MPFTTLARSSQQATKQAKWKPLAQKQVALLQLIFIALLFGPGTVFATSGKVTITSPADGAMIGSGDKIQLSYEVAPGPEGDHVHLNVDGKRVNILRQLNGTTEIDPLAPGMHKICLAVNTKGHIPTGAEECVNVTSGSTSAPAPGASGKVPYE